LRQRLADNGEGAAAQFDVGAVHRRDRRTQAKLAQTRQHLAEIIDPTPLQCAPGDSSGGVLADQVFAIDVHDLFYAAGDWRSRSYI
jgi:hypothetical protein